MCLLVVYSRIIEDAPLIIGANRDERYDRPAEALVVLSRAEPRILGGRDLVAGGTWLCVNEHGVVAGVTNRPSTAGRDPTKRSRGELPLLLGRHRSAREGVEFLTTHVTPTDFNPFWLLVGDRDSLFYLEIGETGEFAVFELDRGTYVLENSPLFEHTTKSDYVASVLATTPSATAGRFDVTNVLRSVLSDNTVPPPASGAKVAANRLALQAPCVHTPQYGTRSSAIIVVPSDERAPIEISVADGAPCEVPYVDFSNRWNDLS